jgi:hypothetical protein
MSHHFPIFSRSPGESSPFQSHPMTSALVEREGLGIYNTKDPSLQNSIWLPGCSSNIQNGLKTDMANKEKGENSLEKENKNNIFQINKIYKIYRFSKCRFFKPKPWSTHQPSWPSRSPLPPQPGPHHAQPHRQVQVLRTVVSLGLRSNSNNFKKMIGVGKIRSKFTSDELLFYLFGGGTAKFLWFGDSMGYSWDNISQALIYFSKHNIWRSWVPLATH